jgi:hypothetical protein
MILIINCSKQKSRYPGPAGEVYVGPLVRLGIQYAGIKGWTALILSGRHGIISPDQVIEPYDERMTEPYPGPWPQESGYWLGSLEYFAKAPPHIIRLLPQPWSYGQQKSFLNRICNPHLYGGK